MAAIADAVRRGDIPGTEVAVVISDKSSAEGLRKASERGIEAIAVARRGRSREEHDREIVSILKDRGIELVCLAGYMRLLSADFVRAFPNRIINIHPSLLPSFPGMDAQRQAIESGVKVSGCTVHFVDEGLDSGPIVAQRAVPVNEDDDVDSLAARILVEEHRLYPQALRRLLVEPWRIDGRAVRFGAGARAEDRPAGG